MSKMVRLSDVADLTVGFVGTMAEHYVDNGVPFLRSLNVKPFSIVSDDLKYISKEFSESIAKSILHEGDIIIVRTGIPGICAVVPAEYDGCNCSDVVIVHPNREMVDENYLAAYINIWGQRQVQNNKVGAIQKHFNISAATEMLIYLPSIEVQKKYAKIILALNEKINNNLLLCTELESMVKTIYDYWFLQFDFPDESGNPYRQSGGKMVWNEELKREIPEGWDVMLFRDILTFLKGRIPKEISSIQTEILNSPYITIDVANNATPQFCSEKSMIKCNGETIMVMDGAASGDIYIGNYGSLGSTFAMLSSLREDISDSMIYMLLQEKMPVYKKANTGSTVPHANRSFIENMKIAIPKDCKLFSKEFDLFFAKIEQLRDENQQLISLRDFLLPVLMNGQVRVE